MSDDWGYTDLVFWILICAAVGLVVEGALSRVARRINSPGGRWRR